MGPEKVGTPVQPPGSFTAPERNRVEALVAASKLADILTRRILAEELVKAQRTTSACAGATSGDQVKAAGAAVRAIIRALGDLGLLEAAPKKNPFEGLDDGDDEKTAAQAPPKKRVGLDDALSDLEA